jgi:hypothetical protein
MDQPPENKSQSASKAPTMGKTMMVNHSQRLHMIELNPCSAQ